MIDDELINTLVIGDSTIKHITMKAGLVADKGKDNTTYKALKNKASIADMAETAKYLLKNRLIKVNKVVLHAGVNDARTLATEKIKEGIRTFSNTVKELGRKLVISGPIPHMNMSSEIFSRVVAMNKWLDTNANELDVTFINNFDLFWSNEHLYEMDRETMNSLGAFVLSNNIRCTTD